MSNKASDNLHSLIKSLSKPEKRYFKLFSARHIIGEKNNYQILFDAIDRQNEYDEEALKKKFKNESFVNKFSIAKSRLYETILKSLDAFHSNSSIDIQIKRLIHYAEILYKKSLYKQSIKILKKAKKIAVKHQRYTSLIEIDMWEKKLIEKDNYTEINEAGLLSIKGEDEEILQHVKNYNDFWNIKSRLFYILNKRGKARSSEELDDFKKIIDDRLLKNTSESLDIRSQYLYYHTYSAYHYGVKDYKNSYDYLLRNIELIEQNLGFFEEEPNIYFSQLTNAIYLGLQLKKYKEAFAMLDKLRAIPETLLIQSNEDMDIKLFSSTYSLELTMHLMMGNFDKGLDLIPVVEEGLRLYGDKINNVRLAYLCFNISAIYFAVGDYNESLRWINKLLNHVTIDKSEDIYCFAQLLNLIVHVELGNDRLLPYAFKSTSRYLETRNRVYKFESITLNFINKILKDKTGENSKKIYEEFYRELAQLENDPFESIAFEYFDFVGWIKSKVENRSFQEVLKEKTEA